jgi:hypothetical protein
MQLNVSMHLPAYQLIVLTWAHNADHSLLNSVANIDFSAHTEKMHFTLCLSRL